MAQVWKWNGALQLAIAAPLVEAWEIASDFGGLLRWMPSIEVCECVEGKDQVPGCVRYVVGGAKPDGQKIWVKERLLALDPDTHSYTYRVEDNNLNLNAYVAGMQLLSSPGEAEGGPTVVKWWFEMDPMSGSPEEVVVDSFIRRMRGAIESLDCVARTKRSCSQPSAPSPSPSPCDPRLVS